MSHFITKLFYNSVDINRLNHYYNNSNNSNLNPFDQICAAMEQIPQTIQNINPSMRPIQNMINIGGATAPLPSLPSVFLQPYLSISLSHSILALTSCVLWAMLLLHKASIYPLPVYAMGMEGVIIVAYGALNLLRQYCCDYCYRAFPSNGTPFMMLQIISLIFIVLIGIFMARLQTYCTLIDVILGLMGIILSISESVAILGLLRAEQSEGKERR